MSEKFLIIRLPLKIGPMDRGDYWEDPLAEKAEAASIAELSGGGTMMDDDGAILFSEVELVVPDLSDERLNQIEQILVDLGAPKGTEFYSGDSETALRSFGTTEVVGIGLDGSDLPDEVYEGFDVEDFVSAAEAALGDGVTFGGSTMGERYTFFYFHGPSADTIQEGLERFAKTQPICQGCQYERLA